MAVLSKRRLVNLVKIVEASSAKRTRIIFVSLIAVVDRLSLAAGTRTAYPAESTVELGYPEAKWACEELLLSLEGKVCAWDE